MESKWVFIITQVSEYCSLNCRQTLVSSLFARGAHVVKNGFCTGKIIVFYPGSKIKSVTSTQRKCCKRYGSEAQKRESIYT